MDDALRTRERSLASPADDPRWLNEQLRLGRLDRHRLRALARLGHEASLNVLGASPFRSRKSKEGAFVLELAPDDQQAYVALALAFHVHAMPGEWHAPFPGHPGELAAIRAWIRCPCDAHRSAIRLGALRSDPTLVFVARALDPPDADGARRAAVEAIGKFHYAVERDLGEERLRRALMALVTGGDARGKDDRGHVLWLRVGGTVYLVDTKRLTMGRGRWNTIVFDDDNDMDLTHCEIEHDEESGAFRLVDRSSANGTWLHAERVREVELCSGDRFCFGYRYADVRLLSRPLPTELREIEQDAAEIEAHLKDPAVVERNMEAERYGHSPSRLASLRHGIPISPPEPTSWSRRAGATLYAVNDLAILRRVLEIWREHDPRDLAVPGAIEAISAWIERPIDRRLEELERSAQAVEALLAHVPDARWRRRYDRTVSFPAPHLAAARAVASAARCLVVFENRREHSKHRDTYLDALWATGLSHEELGAVWRRTSQAWVLGRHPAMSALPSEERGPSL